GRAKQGQDGTVGCVGVRLYPRGPLAGEAGIHLPVIASAAKQSRLSRRKDPGLLRFARNDGE
ncbi:hypothetical protein FXB40_29825, partial [Bradyrhizobium rifense]